MSGDWTRYQELVLSELERLSENIENLSSLCAKLDKDFAIMKVKAGILGSLSATIVSSIILILDHIFRR
jgi:cellobiose-specific phosphotransferase system component IIC